MGRMAWSGRELMPRPRKQSRMQADLVNGHDGHDGHDGQANGQANGHLNGHPNGQANSQTNGHPNGQTNGANGHAEGGDPGAPHIRLQDWEVIDQVSVGSTDYVILRRTRGAKSGIESLTPRERDAVRLACTGASNKDIAWAMGISDSTVGVLLLRARRKLKVVGREELIRAFET
jgi:DNA-binding CsgD family transcriptional regulator